MFWYTERAMGWMICGEQSIEETVEFALAYVANVADLHRAVKYAWAWLPQGMTICRILHRKLFAEDVIMGHTTTGITKSIWTKELHKLGCFCPSGREQANQPITGNRAMPGLIGSTIRLSGSRN